MDTRESLDAGQVPKAGDLASYAVGLLDKYLDRIESDLRQVKATASEGSHQLRKVLDSEHSLRFLRKGLGVVQDQPSMVILVASAAMALGANLNHLGLCNQLDGLMQAIDASADRFIENRRKAGQAKGRLKDGDLVRLRAEANRLRLNQNEPITSRTFYREMGDFCVRELGHKKPPASRTIRYWMQLAKGPVGKS